MISAHLSWNCIAKIYTPFPKNIETEKQTPLRYASIESLTQCQG